MMTGYSSSITSKAGQKCGDIGTNTQSDRNLLSTPMASDPFADRDRGTATGLDKTRQKPIPGGFLGALFEARIPVFKLLSPELFHRLAQFGVSGALASKLRQSFELGGVMVIDSFLDRDGACHGRLFAQGRRDRTEREPGEMP